MIERVLRVVVYAESWVEQRVAWMKLTGWHQGSALASGVVPAASRC